MLNLNVHTLAQRALEYVHERISPNAIVAGGAIRDHALGRMIKDVDVFVSVADLPDHRNRLMQLGFQDARYKPQTQEKTHRVIMVPSPFTAQPAVPVPAATRKMTTGSGIINSTPLSGSPLGSGVVQKHTSGSGAVAGRHGGSGFDAGIVAVYYKVFDGVVVDVVITRNDPIAHVHESFDLAICKAWYTGKGVFFSSDFMKDVTSQSITICTRATIDPIKDKHILNHVKQHAERIRSKYPTFRIVNPYDTV